MYNRRYRRYCCMNNNHDDNKCDKDMLEDACQNEYCNCPEKYERIVEYL